MQIDGIYLIKRVKTTEFNGFEEAKVSAHISDSDDVDVVFNKLSDIIDSHIGGGAKSVTVAKKSSNTSTAIKPKEVEKVTNTEDKPKSAKAKTKKDKTKKALDTEKEYTNAEINGLLCKVAAKFKDPSKAVAILEETTGQKSLANVDVKDYSEIAKFAEKVLNG